MASEFLPSRQLPGVTRFQWQQLLGPIIVVIALTYLTSGVSASFSYLTEGHSHYWSWCSACRSLLGTVACCHLGRRPLPWSAGSRPDC